MVKMVVFTVALTERRVRKLEAENAYLKKSMALKAEKRSRTARKPRS